MLYRKFANALAKTSVMFDTLAYASGLDFSSVSYTATDTTSSLLLNNADYSKVKGNGETFLPLLYFAGAVAANATTALVL